MSMGLRLRVGVVSGMTSIDMQLWSENWGSGREWSGGLWSWDGLRVPRGLNEE